MQKQKIEKNTIKIHSNYFKNEKPEIENLLTLDVNGVEINISIYTDGNTMISSPKKTISYEEGKFIIK